MNTDVEQRLGVNRVAISVEEPERILVVPLGEVASFSGDFIADDVACQAVVEAFVAHGVDVAIDLEHQTLGGEYSSPTGAAPAAGWIKSLDVVPGEGIFANVEWTAEGAEYVKAKQYRYLSPVALVRKRDRRIVGLHSVALTNKPAIVGMKPIVNSAAGGDRNKDVLDKEIDMDAIRKALGLADGADEETCVNAITALSQGAAGHSDFRAAVCKAVSLDPETVVKDDEVVAAVNKLKETQPTSPDPTQYVPMSEHQKLREQVQQSTDQLVAINCATFIGKGLSDGRICEANKAAWETRYKANPDDAEAAMQLVPAGTFPADGRVVANKSQTPPAKSDDAIVANASRFDADRMGDHERVKAYQKANKCSYEEAMAACGEL